MPTTVTGHVPIGVDVGSLVAVDVGVDVDALGAVGVGENATSLLVVGGTGVVGFCLTDWQLITTTAKMTRLKKRMLLKIVSPSDDIDGFRLTLKPHVVGGLAAPIWSINSSANGRAACVVFSVRTSSVN